MPQFASSNKMATIPRSARPVLEDLRIQHGPVTLLGKFFLLADTILAEAGVTLYRTTLAEAAETQAINQTSWHMFPPMLDTRLSTISPDMSYGFLGANARGEVVCAQGGRIYDIGDRTFADITTDQSFFYGSEIPPAPGRPVAEVTAPSATEITGRFVYSGGLWVHPDYRGRRLAAMLPRFSRCYALSMWDTQFTIGMASLINFSPRLVKAYGYDKVEERFTIWNLAPDPMSWAILWMNRDDLEQDLTGFMDTRGPEVDAAIRDSGAQDEALVAKKDR